MFANMRIGARLGVGFAAVLLITVVMGIVGLYNTNQFSRQVVSLGNHTRGAAYLADAQSALWQLRWDVAQFIAVSDPEERRRLAANGPVQHKIVEENLRRFEQSQRGPDELAAVKEVRDSFEKYMAARPKWFDLYGSGQLQEAVEWRARTITVFGAATVKSFAKLIALQREASDNAQGEAAERTTQSRNALLALLVVAVLSGAALAYAITRSITRPLRKAVGIAEEVAVGNLRVEIDARTTDETGRLLEALRHMRDGLAGAVDTMRGAAESVGTASRQIATGNTEMSSRIEEQAASLEESASSMEQLTTAVKQNADNAGRANELAVGASEVAARGGAAMSDVSTTMEGISQSSRKIADIISVIDGIAFQTNILALNAAVEAARAGEQGRGFAVVASEVRGLAQRCAAAAKEIKGLIEESARRVDGGAKLVEGAGRTMEEIVSSVERVTAIMGDISSASREQLAGIEQVGNAVVQMDRMTQQNAALVQETASAAEHMAEQAQHLVTSVARFRTADVGMPQARPDAMPKATVAPPPSRSARKIAAKPRAVRHEPALDWKEF